MSIPKVSVIIPNYNHRRFLRRRIDSVLQQTYQDFEVLLLDDCSTDNSQEILSSFANHPRVRVVLNTVNSGSTFRQWNKGVQLAQGEYIWFAESDDFADPEILTRLVTKLESEPEAALAFCRSWQVSAEDVLDGFVDRYLEYFQTSRWTADYLADGYEECLKYFVVCNIVPNASAVVFRKDAYVRVGGADESFRLCGDWKLWAGMALNGKIAYLSEPLNHYRFHHQSVRGRDKLLDVAAVETIRVVGWLIGKLGVSTAQSERLWRLHSQSWVRAMTGKGLTFKRRWSILSHAITVDPRAVRHFLQALFDISIGNKIRECFLHPLLSVTRPLRHALGLRHRSGGPALKH